MIANIFFRGSGLLQSPSCRGFGALMDRHSARRKRCNSVVQRRAISPLPKVDHGTMGRIDPDAIPKGTGTMRVDRQTCGLADLLIGDSLIHWGILSHTPSRDN